MDNAKKSLFNFQNITLGKRKRDEETDFDKDPTIFGIVTTGVHWQFVRCTGLSKSRKIEITKVYNSGLDEDFGEKEDTEKVKVILSYIVRVLQAQAEAIGRSAKRQ